MAASEKNPESKVISVKLLDFDQKNPRFPEHIAKGDEQALLERFIRDERLQEIIESIADQGFFPGEPLLVTKNGARYTVIEGNRRLASLKLLARLSEPPHGRIAIERAVDEAQFRPEKVQCLIFADGDAILRYLGFRHITGIKSWGSLQKARYMHRLLQQSHGDKDTSTGLRLLARETGSSSSYLAQSMTALRMYEYAEAKNFFDLSLSPDDVEFSLLSTALSYANIVTFVGLESRTDIEANKFKETNLKRLFSWLFVKTPSTKPVVKESRMLKKLAAIVAEPEAVKELDSSGDLDHAFEISKGPSVALSESLTLIQRRLGQVWTLLQKVSEVSDEHKEIAAQIYRSSEDLHETITSRLKKKDTRSSKSTRR